MIPVKLEHTGNGVYTVRSWDESAVLATAAEPLCRPFGTHIELAQYAATGIGFTEPDGTFRLCHALEEKYAVAGTACP